MTRPNLFKELKSKSFYGSLEKDPKRYITPEERKSLREKGQLCGLEIKKEVLKESQNCNHLIETTKQDTICKLKQNLVTGKTPLSDNSTKCGKSSFKNKVTVSKVKKISSSSPTINWAPTSLGKRHPRNEFSYRNLQLPKSSPSIVEEKRRHRFHCEEVEVCKDNTENLANVPSKDSTIHKISSKHLSSPIVLIEKLPLENLDMEQPSVPSCVKELSYGQCKDVSEKNVHVIAKNDMKQCNLLSTNSFANHKDTKLYPIFYSKSSRQTRSFAQAKAPESEQSSPATVSPEALHLTLTSTLKARQTSSPQSSPKNQQMIIDAGQKKFGATQCTMCGMVYTINHPHDQQQHSVYHKRFLNCVKFLGWKKENEVSNFIDGRILKILPSDPKYALKKVEEIRCLIDIDLGFDPSQTSVTALPKVAYMFISNDNQIAGCLLAEQITAAYRLLPSSYEAEAVVACSLQSEQMTCGVSRIWTYYPYRRSGVATRLMDALRNTFTMGCQLELNQVAFSDPTPNGIRFASHYCQTKEFFTYNLHH